MIKESEVLERIGMGIDILTQKELAELHNQLYAPADPEEQITEDDIELEEGWHLIPKEGAH